jgi:hypothetical protein
MRRHPTAYGADKHPCDRGDHAKACFKHKGRHSGLAYPTLGLERVTES